MLNGDSTMDSGESSITMMGKTGNTVVSKASKTGITVNGSSRCSSINSSGVDSGGSSVDSSRVDSGSSGVSVDSRGGGNGVVGLSVSCVVDNGLLNNLMDGVDLVRGRDGDGTGNLNVVGLGNVLLDNDLSLNGDRNLDGDINVILVDLELRNNVGLDRGDPGVSSHRCKDLLLDNGISGSRSKVDGCRGDSSICNRSCRDNGSGKSSGLNKVLGCTSNIRVGSLGNNLLVGLDILVTGLDLLGSNLNGLVANNSVLKMLLDNGGSGSIGVVGLADGYGGRHGVSNSRSGVDASITCNGKSGNGMSSMDST